MALCTACVEQSGLCGRHKKGVLPQLAQPFWYQLVGTHHQKSVVEAMSPEGRRVYNRKRTKAARRATMAAARFASLDALYAPVTA